MAVWEFCIVLSCAAAGRLPFASLCEAESRPHFFVGSGAFTVVVWQISIADATSLAVTATKSATVLHAAGATASDVAASQSSLKPLLRTSNAPGLTSVGLEHA